MNRQLYPLVLFFVLLGFFLLGSSIYVYGMSNVLDFFGLIAFSLFVLWGMYKLTARPARRRRAETPLYTEDKPLKGSVTFINPILSRVDTDEGTSFMVSQSPVEDGFYVQQIDPRSGATIGAPFHGGGHKAGQMVARAIKRRTRGR